MQSLNEVAPAFVEMAHEIVWAAVATVGPDERLRSRVLHPIWQWEGDELVGWVATGPTPVKTAHLAHNPHVSANYWAPSQDNCTAECTATWFHDDETCTRIWELFESTPEPAGYDPTMIPVWTAPTDETFSVLRLDPWRLRVMPAAAMLEGTGEGILNWRA